MIIAADQRYHHMETVRSLLSVATYPLQYVADLPVRAGRGLAQALRSRASLEADNAELKKEHLLLKARLQKFDALHAENMRLRDLVGSSFKVSDRVLIAELVAVDLDPYRQQVVVNKGSASGVFEGQPVLDADGVMGQVIRVTPLTATVLLITDADHSLPVQVNRNGLRTIAEGTGLINRLELLHLPNNADIQEGDLLVTSGLGGHFPPGYPTARVSDVRREQGQPFATVIATPTGHLERSREVLLVWTLTPALVNDYLDQAQAAPNPPTGSTDAAP